MTAFDVNTFAQLTITDSMSTEMVPVPVGEYPATVREYKVGTWQAKDGSSNGLKMFVFWVLDPNDAVKEATGRDENIVRQEMMFDLTDSGALDTGKGRNVRLGRIREAIDLNRPGEPFNFDMMVGRRATVSVGHRADQRDPSMLYAEVKDTAKL